MSQPVVNPTFLSQSPRTSGDVFTGEIQHVRGGGRTITFYSGMASGALIAGNAGLVSAPTGGGADVVLFSGAGRLNSIVPHAQMQSGLAAVFYDAGVATSGGPFPASGHKILGVLPPTITGALWSGHSLQAWQPILNIDVPFQSGLCVALKSGQPGASITLTPERSAAFPAA